MLKHRLISGFAMAIGVLLLLRFLPSGFLVLITVVVSSCGQHECYRLFQRGGKPVYRRLGMTCGAALLLAIYLSVCPPSDRVGWGSGWIGVVMGVTVLALFIRQFLDKDGAHPLENLGCTLLGMLYVPYLLSYMVRLGFEWDPVGIGTRLSETGFLTLCFVISVTKIADIGAYFAGRRFGKHKLIPRLSPGKTWEGLAGGGLSSVLMSLLWSWLADGHLGLLNLHWGHAVVLGVLLSTFGVVGDLFESLIKRNSGAKDSSDSIPGMGGLLDVLDSLLFGGAVLYVYARVCL